MDLASAFGSDDGRGRPPARKAERSIFDPPESREELIEDGQRAAEWVSSSIAWLRTEGADALQGALVLGTVAAVFPRFADALHEAGLGHGDVSGVWVVPPIVVKGIGGGAQEPAHEPDPPAAPRRVSWHGARTRLGPFLKNDLWRRIDGEVRGSLPVDWARMGLLGENAVVVRHRRSWAELARRYLSAASVRGAARGLYACLTREHLIEVAVWLWPFRWWWLAAWAALSVSAWASLHATASVVPVSWHDLLTLWLANVCGIFYAARARAAPDEARREALAFKEAGSIALRRGKLDGAVEQYTQGESCAAKLASMRHLNGAFAARGAELRLACLNNAALVQLKRREWRRAVGLCDAALAIAPTAGAASAALAAAKAHFRKAVGLAKLGEAAAAIECLREANSLAPDDAQVVGMLRVLRWGEERRRMAEQRIEEEAEEAGAAGAARLSGLDASEAAEAGALYGSMIDPGRASEPAAFGQWAAAPPSADGTAAAATAAATAAPAAPRPSQAEARPEPRFRWAGEWLSSRLVGLTVSDDAGGTVALSELRGLKGEAWLRRGRGGRRHATVREFELGFELRWEARVCDARRSGWLSCTELASHAEPDETLLELKFDEALRVEEAADRELVNLLGPLRRDAAMREDRLTRQVWRALDAFRDAFGGLEMGGEVGEGLG